MKRLHTISIINIAIVLLSFLHCATCAHHDDDGVFQLDPVVKLSTNGTPCDRCTLCEGCSSEESSSSPSQATATSAPTPSPTVAQTSAPTASPVAPPAPAPKPDPKPAPAPDSGKDDSKRNVSRVILSYILLSTWIIAIIFFCVALKSEIKAFFIQCRANGISGCFSSFRSGRSSTGLDDIIFDPDDEQRASLSESLLASS